MVKTQTKYDIYGIIVLRTWYGNLGLQEVEIKNIERNRLSDIKKNPLQDYNQFGAQAIEYVSLTVYKRIETETKTTTFKTPYLTIEKQDKNANMQQIDKLIDQYYDGV